jgi:hypothetical protein
MLPVPHERREAVKEPTWQTNEPLTVRVWDVSRMLGITYQRAQLLVASGAIPSHQRGTMPIPKQRVIRLRDLSDWIADQVYGLLVLGEVEV